MSGKFWATAGTSQENNAIEDYLADILRDYDPNYKKTVQLETCGPSSIEAILTAIGVDLSISGQLQFSDYLTLAMNDARIVPKRNEWTQPVNRYLEAYPIVLGKIFGDEIESKIAWYGEGSKAEIIRKYLSLENTCVLLSLVDPGHYIGALHIDKDTVFYNESWLNNYWNRGTERVRSININELAKNVKYGLVVITKK